MENMRSGQTLKTVVTSVAQDDKLPSHQCMMLPASRISTGLSDEPSLGPDSKDQGQNGLVPRSLLQ